MLSIGPDFAEGAICTLQGDVNILRNYFHLELIWLLQVRRLHKSQTTPEVENWAWNWALGQGDLSWNSSFSGSIFNFVSLHQWNSFKYPVWISMVIQSPQIPLNMT